MKSIKTLLRSKKAPEKDQSIAGFVLNPDQLSISFDTYNNSTREEDLEKGFKKLLENTLVKKGKKPKKAVVFLSGMYSQSSLSIVRFNREEPSIKITPKEYKQINKKLSLIAQNETEAGVSKAFGTSFDHLSLINTQQVQIKVDNFIVSNPVDHKGESVEISYSNSFSSENLIKKIERVLKKEKINLITITDLSKALLTFAPDHLKEQKDYLLLVKAGNNFDINVIFENQIVTTRTLPLGLETIVSNVDWFLIGLEQALSSFEGIKTFPTTIAIYPHSKELEKQIANYGWTKNLPFQSEPSAFGFDLDLESLTVKTAQTLN